MKLTFGRHKNTDVSLVPDDYLCWVCAKYKGQYKDDSEFEIPENEFIAAREELKKRGYNTKGMWPKKELR